MSMLPTSLDETGDSPAESPPLQAPALVTRRDRAAPDTTGRRRAEGGRRLSGEDPRAVPDRPLVTVVTVCFNAARTLAQCVDSVLTQTYPNVEYVVVDGSSDDGTVELLERYAEHIDYFVSEPDSGLYNAMNKGLALASGEYILFPNADDWYVADAIEQLVAAASYANADVVSALAQAIDANAPSSDLRPAADAFRRPDPPAHDLAARDHAGAYPDL